MKTQDLMHKFPHLPEKIFQKMDNEDLFKCREVAKSWQNIIDGRNYPWLRMVDMPKILHRGNTYLHFAAETSQMKAFKTALNKEEDINIRNECDKTPFHHACHFGSFKIVQLLMENKDLEIIANAKNNFGIDFNATTSDGMTAFHTTCIEGHSNLVEIFMKNAEALNIDLNAKWHDNTGDTGFHLACSEGHSDVVKIILENACASNIDLNAKDNDGWTAFQMACHDGHPDVVKIFMEKSSALSIDLNAKTSQNGKTAFQWACVCV